MRKTLFLICLFFFYTCDFDFQLNKKITVNEFIEDELKSFSWNQVDQYPVFENCLNFNDKAQKNNCFVYERSTRLTAKDCYDRCPEDWFAKDVFIKTANAIYQSQYSNLSHLHISDIILIDKYS